MYVIPTFNVGDDDSNEKITDDEMAHKQVDDDISATVVEGDLTILIKLTFYVNYFECRIVSTDCVILVFKYDTITIIYRAIDILRHCVYVELLYYLLFCKSVYELGPPIHGNKSEQREKRVA